MHVIVFIVIDYALFYTGCNSWQLMILCYVVAVEDLLLCYWRSAFQVSMVLGNVELVLVLVYK